MFLSFIPLSVLIAQGLAILLPNLTGPGLVGTVSLELIDYNRLDPLAPTPQFRDLILSLLPRPTHP